MRQNTSILYILTYKCASPYSGVQFFDKCGHSGVFSTSQLQKVVRACSVLYIMTSKCASRHSGVQFFNIGTAKSGPDLTCFVHFHLKMCFSPQRRAIFHIATSKSGPNMQCFVHFDFKMCFSPQRRAIFDFSSDHMTPHPPL